MFARFGFPVLCIALLGLTPTIDPAQYQSFVGNWTPASKPLCAAVGSASQWNRIFHPAPVMGTNRPFSPPDSFWAQHALLVVARVVDAGDTSRVFRVNYVTRTGNVVTLDYAFRPTPYASSTIKWWTGVAIARPLPATVRYRENGRIACSLDLAHGQWSTLVASAPAAPTTDRSSPVGVVNAFYAWYMKHDLFGQLAEAKPYLTTGFYTNFATVLRAQRCLRTAIIDWDPFNGSQIDTASYSVGAAAVRGNTASVPVHLMLRMYAGRAPFAGKPVTIALVRTASGWRIDDAIDQPGGSLQRGLRSNLVRLASWQQRATASQRACLRQPIP
jgi:hypothetical protein